MNCKSKDHKEIKSIVEGFYSEVETKLAGKNYGFFMNPEKIKLYYNYGRIAFYYDFVVKCMNLGVDFNHKHIADFACGGGFLLKAISEYSTPATLNGFDTLQDAVDFARLISPFAAFKKKSILDRYTQKWDIVVATEVLEHMIDPGAALDILWDRVAEGGCLIITVPDGRKDQLGANGLNAETHSYTGHINFWSPESFTYYMSRKFRGVETQVGVVPDRTQVLDKLYAIIFRV